MLLRGNCYGLIVDRAGAGLLPAQVELLAPERVQVAVNGTVVVLFVLRVIANATVKELFDLDLQLIVGVVLTSAFFVIMFNLIVDILYAALDPRVRYA